MELAATLQGIARILGLAPLVAVALAAAATAVLKENTNDRLHT